MRTDRRRDVRVQPGVLTALTLAIAYGTGAWVQVLHHAQGATEVGEPGPITHWLRDATLSLPLVAAAIWIGLLVARRVIRGAQARPGFATAITAVSTAFAAAYVLAAGNPLHGLLFPVAEAGHQHQSHGAVQHAALDGLAALPVTVLVAALVCAWMVRRRPWEPVSPFASRISPRLLVPARRAALALTAVAPVAILVAAVPMAGAGGGPGRPCPSAAPVKTFDVQAIDVDIPLNRFGDHDPQGKMFVLSDQVSAVRAQEQSRQVSVGLRDDPIQPLVIRANLGDCVEVRFTNRASGGEYGFNIDGVAFGIESSGDAVGRNVSSTTNSQETRTYRFWIPREKTFEGAHYIKPGAGQRDAIAHGLFGTLVAEPKGSRYLHPDTGRPLDSGWEAMIVPGNGQKAFREYTEIMHEVGNEEFAPLAADGQELPMVDPTSSAYRPGARAINYRSEPFMRRMERKATAKSHAYGSFTFGDPATPQSRAYLGDPVKRRVVHGGSEMFHVYHLHGGGIRWRANPHADTTFDYQDTGLRKHPPASQSPSSRLDSQSMGPGEAYDLQMEGGAGGVQQVAGEFLWHCHIAEHYVAGMWTFWRVFDTKQVDLAPLPDRGGPPAPVDSRELIGKTINGSTITADTLDEWIKPQLPPQGVPANDEDATVWNYDVQDTANGPLYLGAPEDRSTWPDLRQESDHPGGLPGDEFVDGRPVIKFNPTNGRPAFPLMRPQIGQRPPFSPNGHSGAPWLGERANQAKQGAVDPWANRPDGICPAGARSVPFNVVAIEKSIPVAGGGGSDANGKIFVLAEDKDAVLAGTKQPEPLVIRANEGECVELTLTSEFVDAKASDLFSKVNMHVHHVQFDTQASDGVISGMSFEQSVRPYATENKRLSAAAAEGATQIQLTSVAGLRPGIDIAVGQGEADIEVNRIASIAGTTVTLEKALKSAHASGEAAGVEFVQSRWYPDVLLDNVFWHDHVDGIHGWGHGLVGQIIVEPQGSTYHDPQTGAEIRSGAIADIRTNGSLIGDKVKGSFREFALFTIDQNPVTDSTINLRAEPWSQRLATDPDPSLLFSSYRHGDPRTPLPKAYAGDPVVIRAMNVAPGTDTVRLEGHRFDQELRLPGTKKDSIVQGVSERFSLSLEGGAGGPGKRTGDFLYHNGIQRRFKQGAWGLFRVFSQRQVAGLQPLPGHPVNPSVQTTPTQTGGRPPVVPNGGEPCPSGAPSRTFDVSAVDVGTSAVFVPRTGANAVVPANPAPLVLHAAAGDCVTVNLKNERATPATGPAPRVSFNVSEVDRTERSSGVNAGFNPEQTVAVGQERQYRFHVDAADIGSATISDMGSGDATAAGAYGALVVAPAGALFRDPVSGQPRDVGDRIDVHVPGGQSYRDLTMTVADADPIIGGDFTPYKTAVEGASSLNHRAAVRAVGPAMFSSRANGDPETPVFNAYPGDPVRVHAIGAPGSEQPHVFSLGGHSWPIDPRIANSTQTNRLALGPWNTIDAHLTGGAGGLSREQGDYLHGDVRGPFTEAGLWGLLRVTSDSACPVRPLPGLDCIGQPSLVTDEPQTPAPAGSTPAPQPALGAVPAPSSNRPAAPRAPAPLRLRNLKVAKRVRLSDLAKKGLVLRLTAPARSRAMEIVLSRRRGRVDRTMLRSIVRMPGGGNVSVRWRPTRKQVAKLKAGTYKIRVRVGPARSKLGRDRLTVTLKLTGKAPRATTTKATTRKAKKATATQAPAVPAAGTTTQTPAG
jgi:hypothetical protein